MNKTKILVVEKESAVADDIKMSLKRLGYSVCGIAISGEEAIKKAEELHPDLVLMDFVLDGIGGIETAGIICSRFNIPVVYLIPNADKRTLKKAKISEPFGYILKPFKDRDLHSTVEIVLYKHKMENRLKESEEKYRTLYSSLNEGVCLQEMIYDKSGKAVDYRIKDFNPAYEMITGLKREKAVGNEGSRLYGTGDAPYLDIYAEVASSGKATSFETYFPPLKKHLSISVFPLEKDKLVTLISDISERKEVEEAIVRLASVPSQNPNPVIEVNLASKVTYLNPAAKKKFPGLQKLGPKHEILRNLESIIAEFHKGKQSIVREIDLGQEVYEQKLCYIPESKRIRIFAYEMTESIRTKEALKKSLEKLQRTFEQMIKAIASALERRDPYTAGHQQGVTKLACAIAEEMGLSTQQIDGIRLAGLIHDIGKIQVPQEILSKPGRLSEMEFNMIKMHPQVGYDILKEIEFPYPVANIILQHHERMDGSGYPARLSGKKILLEARILAVADAIEAMSSPRSHRSELGIENALEEISQNKGTLYDPEVVDACLKLFQEKGFKFDSS